MLHHVSQKSGERAFTNAAQCTMSMFISFIKSMPLENIQLSQSTLDMYLDLIVSLFFFLSIKNFDVFNFDNR